MGQDLSIDLRGQRTNLSPLVVGRNQNVLLAQDCVVDRPSYIEGRRGWNFYGTTLSMSPGDTINKLAFFKNRVLVQYKNKLAYDSDGNGTWVDYSYTHSPITGYRMRSILANSSIYFTSSGGIKKISSLTGTVGSSGVPKAISLSVADSGGGAGTLTNNRRYAWRAVWTIKDANNFLVTGYPSQRFVYLTVNTNAVSVTVDIPAGITTSHKLQIYRSFESASSAIDPDDELFQVSEDSPSSTDISNGYITITDSTPVSLLGAALYTNPSQEGFAAANNIPPIARDIAYWKDRAWFGYTTRRHQLFATLISSGITAGDEFTVNISGNSCTFTGAAAENFALREFKVSAAADPATKIAETAQSLVRVINRGTWSFTAHIYAYYTSGFDDLPGQMFFETRTQDGAQFWLTSNSTAAGGRYNPELPTSGSAVASENQDVKNRVYFSKSFQPEHVPDSYYFDIGSSDFAVECVLALRDSMIVFKQDGIFRIFGEDKTSFRTMLIDDSAIISSRESAVTFNNEGWFLGNQGVLSVSDTGVTIRGRDVEDQIIPLLANDNIQNAFSISYETDRRIIMYLPTLEDDYPTKAWTFSHVTNSWTVWSGDFGCGLTNLNNDKLYFGHNDNFNVYQERKDRESTDFRDESYSVSITAFSGATATLASVTNVAVGQSLYQGGNNAQITAINGLVLTLDAVIVWTIGAAEVSNAVTSTVQFAPMSNNNPGVMKHFQEVTIMFDYADTQNFTLSFTSNFDGNTETRIVSPAGGQAWGQFIWGQSTWGAGRSRTLPRRAYVPPKKQKAHWLNFTIQSSKAFNSFALIGVSFIHNPVSPTFRS